MCGVQTTTQLAADYYSDSENSREHVSMWIHYLILFSAVERCRNNDGKVRCIHNSSIRAGIEFEKLLGGRRCPKWKCGLPSLSETDSFEDQRSARFGLSVYFNVLLPLRCQQRRFGVFYRCCFKEFLPHVHVHWFFLCTRIVCDNFRSKFSDLMMW